MVGADERVEILRPNTKAQSHVEEHGEVLREGSFGFFEEALKESNLRASQCFSVPPWLSRVLVLMDLPLFGFAPGRLLTPGEPCDDALASC